MYSLPVVTLFKKVYQPGLVKSEFNKLSLTFFSYLKLVIVIQSFVDQ